MTETSFQTIMPKNFWYVNTFTSEPTGCTYVNLREMLNNLFEVFSVSESEVSWMIRHGVIKSADSNGTSTGTSNNYVVRLRGIPFSATVADIKEFFSGSLFNVLGSKSSCSLQSLSLNGRKILVIDMSGAYMTCRERFCGT